MLAWLRCKWSFDVASWMLARLQYKWSVVVASWQRWMLSRLRCKWSFDMARCKYWCNFNASASVNVECCHLEKMNCWRSFMVSVRMKYWTLARLRYKWSVVVASWQKWMLAQLRYEWSVDVVSMQIKYWGSFMKKRESASTASLQKQMMVWLHSRCKCKYCFTAKMNVGMASVQEQMLAQLHGKDSWCGYITKTLELAALKR